MSSYSNDETPLSRTVIYFSYDLFNRISKYAVSDSICTILQL